MNTECRAEEWFVILNTMMFYQRKEGYVDEIDGKLMFFDSDPFRNCVHACHVTLDDVREIIEIEKAKKK